MELTIAREGTEEAKARMDELAEEYGFVEMEEILHTEADTRAFEVRDVSAAAWAAGKLIHENNRVAAAREYVKAAKKRLDSWVAEIEEQARATEEFFIPHLKAFAEVEIEGKKRSMTLPNGTKIGFRKLPSILSVPDDETEVIEILENGGPLKEAVRVVKSINKKALRKFIDAGEVIPGVSVIEQGDRFYVEEAKD